MKEKNSTYVHQTGDFDLQFIISKEEPQVILSNGDGLHSQVLITKEDKNYGVMYFMHPLTTDQRFEFVENFKKNPEAFKNL